MEMVNCRKCGTEVMPEDTFCSKCGVKNPSETPAPSASRAADLGNRLLWIALGLQVLIVPWNTTTGGTSSIIGGGWNSVLRYAPIFDPPTLVASGAPAPSIAVGRLILQLIVTVIVGVLLNRALRRSGESPLSLD